MSIQPNVARHAFGHIAPALAEITDRALFGQVWERPALSPRDRSVITGWPTANTALPIAQRVFDEAGV